MPQASGIQADSGTDRQTGDRQASKQEFNADEVYRGDVKVYLGNVKVYLGNVKRVCSFLQYAE